VHALGNVLSFTPPFAIPINKLADALNCSLPLEIRVVKAEKAGQKFNARFDAKSKTYEYLIYNGKTLNPLFLPFVWQIKAKLNVKAMKKAAKYLVGKHDFSSFCASRSDDKNKIRIIHSFDICHFSFVIWGSCKLPVIRCRVTGNGFLYKMVRNIVGTLVEVGLGKRKPEDIKQILKAKNRKAAGRTAPAQGLCLIKVDY